MLTVGSLFSGIGGFDLGLERAGMRVLWQSEIDPYASAVLRKHWPSVPNLGDITGICASSVANAKGQRNANGEKRTGWPISDECSNFPDVLCGGFPCQDISNAGKREGIGGERSGLWSEFARLIGELRPSYVIVENVAALLGRGMERVLGDLSTLGYDAEWTIISAADVGAPHLRERVWIVAYPNECGTRCAAETLYAGQSESGESGDVADADEPRLQIGELLAGIQSGTGRGDERQNAALGGAGRWITEPDVGRVVARLSPRVDGGRLDGQTKNGGTGEILRALRDGVRPQDIQWPVRGLGRFQTTQVLLDQVCEYQGAPRSLGNVSLSSKETSQVVMRGVWFDGTTACPSCRRFAAEQRTIEHPDIVRLLSQLLACACGSTWLDQTGTPSDSPRVARLRCLGNSIVPQIAEIIGRAIVSAHA